MHKLMLALVAVAMLAVASPAEAGSFRQRTVVRNRGRQQQQVFVPVQAVQLQAVPVQGFVPAGALFAPQCGGGSLSISGGNGVFFLGR